MGQSTEGTKIQAKQKQARTLGERERHTAIKSPVWTLASLSLTEVPGHSVPEAETCRGLHRCELSGLQCAWAPGQRKTGEEVR